MFENILHKFYAATVSVGLDGSMLVSSNRDRLMAWAMIFCFLSALSLISYLVWRKPRTRKLSIIAFVMSLGIPIFVIPSSMNEFIHVSNEKLTIDSGFWYMRSTTVVKLDNLQNLRRDSHEYMVSNLIGDDYVTWHFERLDGSVDSLILNDFFSAHSMTIAHFIRDRGNSVEWLRIKNQ